MDHYRFTHGYFTTFLSITQWLDMFCKERNGQRFTIRKRAPTKPVCVFPAIAIAWAQYHCWNERFRQGLYHYETSNIQLPFPETVIWMSSQSAYSYLHRPCETHFFFSLQPSEKAHLTFWLQLSVINVNFWAFVFITEYITLGSQHSKYCKSFLSPEMFQSPKHWAWLPPWPGSGSWLKDHFTLLQLFLLPALRVHTSVCTNIYLYTHCTHTDKKEEINNRQTKTTGHIHL